MPNICALNIFLNKNVDVECSFHIDLAYQIVHTYYLWESFGTISVFREEQTKIFICPRIPGPGATRA